jgi:predicted nuclease of predicted toxin-antitoxin system
VTLKLLLDQGLPRSAAGELVRRGLDAVHTGDIGMATATDEQILEHARREGRVVVTLDADFHALLALSNAAMPAVVRVRIEGLRGEELAELVERVVGTCEVDLRAGAMVTVDKHSVRVRGLPLVR